MARFVKEVGRNYNQFTPEDGPGSGSVSSVALTAPTGFTVTGSPIVSSGTLALAFTTGYGIPPLMTGNSGKFLTTNGTTMSWVNITGTDVTGAALTENDDTNVTMTLGGTPSTALLRSVSMSLGWTGQLAVSRGGTGANSLQGVLIGNLTAPVTAVTGIGGQLLRANPSTGVYEFFTPSYMSNPMTTLGDIIYGNAAGAPTRLAANGTANNMYLRSVSGGTPSWASIAGGDITGAALTEVDDTNVTCTLGGTPANALLRSVSLTFGWTGQLSVPRGGTGAATLTGVVIGNSTGAMTAVAGTSEQLLRRNTANTAYEFFTPTFLSNPMTSLGDIIYGNAAGAPLRLGANATSTNKFLRSVNGGTPSWEELPASVSGSGTTNYVAKWTSSTALGNSQIIDNGTNVGIGISPSHKLDVNGNIGISGTIFLSKSGTSNVIYDSTGGTSILIGSSATAATYYTQTTHYFQSRSSVNYTTIGSSGIDVIGIVTAGNVSATNGSIMLQDNYSNGHFGNVGTMFSGGNFMLGYGVTPSTSSATAFLSSVFISGTDLTRSSMVLGENVSIYTGAAQSVAIGSSVTMSERFRMENNGRLRLNAYTSSLSFTGIAAGYLAFTSGGYIITTATPGGVSGTQDYLAKFDSTGIAVGNSRIVDNGTNFLLNSASSYVTGLNLIGDIGIQSASGQASAILMRSNQTPTSGTSIGIFDSYAITTGTTYTQGGGIDFRASQNWNSTSAGTDIYVQTAPDNTIAPADMFVFLNNGAVRFIGRTSNPIGAAAGTMYYNSSANNMRYYNGTSWITF